MISALKFIDIRMIMAAMKAIMIWAAEELYLSEIILSGMTSNSTDEGRQLNRRVKIKIITGIR